MYEKNKKVYADTYKYLKHKTRRAVGLSILGSADEFEEVDMTLPIAPNVVGSNFVTWENGKLAFTVSELSYNAIKMQIIKSRYSNDEQIAIMLNKDLSDQGKLDYSRMQAWRDFASEMARIIDEEGYEAITALQVAKDKKMAEIAAYDSSPNVNSFTIQGNEVWLDKNTRAGLKLRFEAEIAMGQTETTLWYGVLQFKIPLTQAMQMLYAIELYASVCYDNTQSHYSNVIGLSTVEEVLSYNHQTGYPEKLVF